MERGASRVRAALVGASTIALLGVAATVFWYEDARYSLPTPEPAGLAQPHKGDRVDVKASLERAGLSQTGPTLLHFFNPDCPCSRFNLQHVRELRSRFGSRVTFIGVIEARIDDEGDRADAMKSVEGLGFDLPYVLDGDGSIAKAAGVYSTPQGVLLDAESTLVFRGNYNVSRFCTDPRTEFVKLAVESFLASEKDGVMPPEARAYGCELPSAEPKQSGFFAALFKK